MASFIKAFSSEIFGKKLIKNFSRQSLIYQFPIISFFCES